MKKRYPSEKCEDCIFVPRKKGKVDYSAEMPKENCVKGCICAREEEKELASS